MNTAKRRYVMTARAAKADATKQRIRAAAADLFWSRPADLFTLDDVATRAGTTVQTVLRTFGSKDTLVLAALQDLAAAGAPMRPIPPGDVAEAVGAFFDIYETIGDLVIRRLADEPRHTALKPALDAGRANHREGVRRAFAPQLARRDGAARTRLLHALTAATDVYVWKLLRRDFGLDRTTAEMVVRDMIVGVITREEDDGPHPVAELVGGRQPAA